MSTYIVRVIYIYIWSGRALVISDAVYVIDIAYTNPRA